MLSGLCNVHCSVTRIPFVTSFCRGYGKKVYHNGKVVIMIKLLMKVIDEG